MGELGLIEKEIEKLEGTLKETKFLKHVITTIKELWKDEESNPQKDLKKWLENTILAKIADIEESSVVSTKKVKLSVASNTDKKSLVLSDINNPQDLNGKIVNFKSLDGDKTYEGKVKTLSPPNSVIVQMLPTEELPAGGDFKVPIKAITSIREEIKDGTIKN